MSYIPPYSGQAISGKVTDFDLLTLDQDLRKWYVYNDVISLIFSILIRSVFCSLP